MCMVMTNLDIKTLHQYNVNVKKLKCLLAIFNKSTEISSYCAYGIKGD